MGRSGLCACRVWAGHGGKESHDHPFFRFRIAASAYSLVSPCYVLVQSSRSESVVCNGPSVPIELEVLIACTTFLVVIAQFPGAGVITAQSLRVRNAPGIQEVPILYARGASEIRVKAFSLAYCDRPSFGNQQYGHG